MSWQEVGAFLGALITILVTISAFAFNYLRRDNASLTKAQLDIAGLVKDINAVSRSIDRLEKLIADVSEESEERDARLDAKLEKMTELLLKVVGTRRPWSKPRE